jgi:hypothetical protein
MNHKRKKKIHIDKRGFEFIKETYFIGGKMKFNRIYVIDGIPVDDFYRKNATDLDFFINGDYELIGSNNDPDDHYIEQNNNEPPDNEGFEDYLPF